MMRMLNKTLCSLLVAATCLLAVLAPVSISAGAQEKHGAQKPTLQNSNAPQKEFKFEVVSIRPVKPGTPGFTNLDPSPNGYESQMSLRDMIMVAYVPGSLENWNYTPILNRPKDQWFNVYYQINARVANEDLTAWQHQGPNRELLRSALKAMLKERCKLVIHTQPKEVQDYKLVIGKKRPKLKENAEDPKLPHPNPLPNGGYVALTKIEGRRILEEYFHAVTMQELCAYLNTGSSGPPIHDATGLTGRYDFKLESADPSSDSPDGVSAWQLDSLGLKIQSGKSQGFSIVIDHIEKPTPN